MRTRSALPMSWFWLAGFLLLADAHALFDVDITEAGLKRRVFQELKRQPAWSRQCLDGLAYTEDGIAAATPAQLGLLTRLLRRAVIALRREQRRQRARRGERHPARFAR